MNADGSNVRRIVADPEYDAEPRWSPDGKKILFVTGRNDNFDVYEANADGTGQRNLTADYDKNDGAPAWSPDGNNIAFVRTIQGKEQIFVMNADGTNLKRVTNNSSNNGRPAWSPDGSKLAFQTDRTATSKYMS
jgi:Tol biopolymer transport system component